MDNKLQEFRQPRTKFFISIFTLIPAVIISKFPKLISLTEFRIALIAGLVVASLVSIIEMNGIVFSRGITTDSKNFLLIVNAGYIAALVIFFIY